MGCILLLRILLLRRRTGSAVLTLRAFLLVGLGQLLLHLAFELFGLAAQHFLLPAFLEALLRIVWLVRQVFLPLGERIEFFERIFDILLVLLGGRSGLRGLVLVLLRVQFQIEEAGEIAAGAAATAAATALLAKCDFDLPEGRLSAQQRLQRFLFQRNRILPLRAFQLVCRGAHGSGRLLHILIEIGELLVSLGDVAALHANRKCVDLVAQFLLCIGKELPCAAASLGVAVLSFCLLPGCGDQLFFALGYFRLVVAASSATAPAPT